MAEGGTTLEFTPTWIVAVVCTFIVVISLAVERLLHYLGKAIAEAEGPEALFDALQKIKEELMLLGFISLLLTVFQNRINTICLPEHWAEEWLPCNKEDESESKAAAAKKHFVTSSFSFFAGGGRGK